MTKTILQFVEPSDNPPQKPVNPFENLEALRNPQDHAEFFGGEVVSKFVIRRLATDLHLRVNPDPEYTLKGANVLEDKDGVYFVYPNLRHALGTLTRQCNLHVSVNGHGEYAMLLIKQSNPEQEENNWYTTAAMVANAAIEKWVKVTKTNDGAGWAYIPVDHKMFVPTWPTRPFKEMLLLAFKNRVIDTVDHPRIKLFERLGRP